MFRNLIFDWSGTLVDDLGPVIEATNAVLANHDVPPLDRESFRRRFRLPYSEFYAEVLPHIPLEDLEAHFRIAFDAAHAPVTVLPHAREQLAWCAARGIRTFVLSSLDSHAFEQQLDAFGLRPMFEATYSGVLDKRQLIHQILATHGLDPSETAFVGDMTHDVLTARHGGIASIAVLTGYQHPEILANVRPDLTVPDLGVLRTLLDRHRRAPRPVATVGALIHDGAGRVLLLRSHKWSNLWGMPGGKIRRGEESLAALHREVREETALALTDVRFISVQDCIDSSEYMRPEHFIILNHLARALATDVHLNNEAEEFAWLPPAEALTLELNQPTRNLLVETLGLNLLA
jgi:phosphoglycolate phosphatase-like HAD superfamily hydrolase/8-oxo-dGTP pyrophosphatase MutT (NUDIX family)